MICSRDVNDQIARLLVRYKRLLARDHELVAFACGPGADSLQIASGAGFGHCNGAHGFAGNHSRQPSLLLVGASITKQITAAYVIVDGEVGRGTGKAGVAEFLDHDRVVPKISRSSAEFLRDLRTKQPGLAARSPKRTVDDAGFLPALKFRRDL